MSWYREQLHDPLPPEPLTLAQAWLEEARARATQPNPNAMVLATVNGSGLPDARVVLCKEIVPAPGYVTFYTNYESAKGTQLALKPHAALVMLWDHLQRQVRISGPVVKTDAANSDEYFATRHWQSRVGAWASRQSQPISDFAALHRNVDATAERFGVPLPRELSQPDPGVTIPRPPHWGGFQVWAESVELWVAGDARIHERARWQRHLLPAGAGYSASAWTITRLQP